MSDEDKKANRFRRVPAEEKKGRTWPDKDQQASSYPGMLNPDINQKDKIFSVITALPLLMLMIGMVFWYLGEDAQKSGEYIPSQSVELVGQFDHVSVAQSAGGKQHHLWMMRDGKMKTLRITAEQYARYKLLATGDDIVLTAAPTVIGSTTLWVIDAATP